MKVGCGVVPLLLMTLLADPCEAASIEVSPSDNGERGVVIITGTFEFDDIEQFQTKTLQLSRAIVVFSSAGGNLEAGIQIGRTIRMKGYMSLVPDGASCASACALAWLGGTIRMMGPSGQVGFHAAYTVENGTPQPTSGGNALVGAYLNQIGLPDRAVLYITSTYPQEITWLKLQDAESLGIDVQPFTFETKSEEPAPAVPTVEAPVSAFPPAETPAPAEAPAPAVPPATAAIPPPAIAPAIPSPTIPPTPPEAAIAANLLEMPAAAKVQDRLRELGYLDEIADGIWGPSSRAALRQFRRTQGLGGDDRWDSATQQALMSDQALRAGIGSLVPEIEDEARFAPPRGALRNPLNRNDAIWAQDRLHALGYYTGNEDGIWDVDSRSALQRFETQSGLPPDDTWNVTVERRLRAAKPNPAPLHHGRQT